MLWKNNEVTLFNQKILGVIDELQRRSDYEEENKIDILEKDRMLAITRDTGEFYNLLLKSISAERVLEIGLSHGYSTLWFADAILSENPSNSRIISMEIDFSKIKRAQENFRKAGIENFVQIKQGDAIESLNELLAEFKTSQKPFFDFVFLDADKKNSIKYFELVLPMLRKNGIIAADNILDMKEMEEYAKYVKTRPGIRTMTLPVGWGQELSIKIK